MPSKLISPCSSHGQDRRAADPAQPAKQQAEDEDLGDRVPVILHMDERPEQRRERRSPARRRAASAASRETESREKRSPRRPASRPSRQARARTASPRSRRCDKYRVEMCVTMVRPNSQLTMLPAIISATVAATPKTTSARRGSTKPEIVGGIAGALRKQHQQRHLDRRRYQDDQGDGDAVAGKIRQMPRRGAVPDAKRRQRGELAGQQGEDRQAEGRPASPGSDAAAVGFESAQETAFSRPRRASTATRSTSRWCRGFPDPCAPWPRP